MKRKAKFKDTQISGRNLKLIRKSNVIKSIIGPLNINSGKNRFHWYCYC